MNFKTYTKTSIHLLVIFSLLLIKCHNAEEEKSEETGADWRSYLGDKQSSQYSPLEQVNKSNVNGLKIAWQYYTDDSDGREIQCNPLIIDGVMYGTTGKLKCFALNAATGEEKWVFDPFADADVGGGNNRGLAYWEDGDDKRIFHCAGSRMYALDAETGDPVPSFGDNGSISLHTGLGQRAKDLWVIVTTPGVIYQDLYIIGGRVSEGYNAAPGYIRAFNVRTGALEWTFHTIPIPGEYGYHTWPANAYQTVGGVNSWAGMALDEERGIVYIPTGSASFDSYGGNRLGANLFANCLLALDASTGKRLWHYQTIHHDIWDMDLPSPPNLLTIEKDGKKIPVVAQTTKTGNTFVFNRVTGEPIWPIKQIPIEPSQVPGEQAWPTQPMPSKPAPFTRQTFTEDLITNRTPEAHAAVLEKYRQYKSGKTLIPPSLQGTIIFPGFDGGAEWGGSAVDPEKGILYVNSNEMVWTVKLIENKAYEEIFTQNESPGRALYQMHCANCHGDDLKGDQHYGYPGLISLDSKYNIREARAIVTGGKGMMPGFSYLNGQELDLIMNYLYRIENNNQIDLEALAQSSKRVVLPYGHQGFHRLLDPDGYPAIKPPWGNLTAIDLNKGEILWQTPLGSFDELTAQGIPRTGTENYGGPIVTAGGLIFIGASKDERMHAFDQETGELLWEHDLPAGGYATPATYMVNGKQYIVIACGGDKMGTESGDSYVAFALE